MSLFHLEGSLAELNSTATFEAVDQNDLLSTFWTIDIMVRGGREHSNVRDI